MNPDISDAAQNFNQAAIFIAALTGQDGSNAVVDIRALHDTDKAQAGHAMRGTLQQLWPSILDYQAKGFGVFINVNEMDGQGRELANVQAIRAHVIDLDNLSSQQNLERASQWYPAPSFAVCTSANKFHVYWRSAAYRDNDRFTVIQRKLRQLFDSDKSVVDPTRVLRLPGTLHLKRPDAPHLVTCWRLSGFGSVTPAETLEAALAAVNVIDGAGGARKALGTDQAPNFGAATKALQSIDPNSLDRDEWLKASFAFRQAATGFVHDDLVRMAWDSWCAQYASNDPAENAKQWRSADNGTAVGWTHLHWKAYGRPPQPDATTLFGGTVHQLPPGASAAPLSSQRSASSNVPTPQFGEMLTPQEQQTWFKDCILIGPENRIIGPRGIRYDAGSFNASYGGKKFIIDGTGKQTDEAWKAATRSTMWTIPKVDGTCFRPERPTGDIIRDGLGRTYVNTHVPATIERMDGDPSPFLNHLALILPNENDQRILLQYLAHNAKFPGHKILWSPLIQSTEGVGKNVFKQIIRHVIDKQYFYQPKAKQLNESGSKFNGWMDSKLFFLVDEIKTDEKRDMVETLKPFISETELEIEGKGSNQKMADTPGNWMFFSNYKDAIPIHTNGRRFAIFYSAIQSVDDLTSRGMGDAYFNNLYKWLGDEQNGGHRTGLKIVADYLMRYPIERGSLPVRAPATTSTAEALLESRGWLEQLIAEAVDDGLPGFRGGWISTAAVAALLSKRGNKPVAARTLGKALGEIGYHNRGQAGRAYFQDDPNKRGYLWNADPGAHIGNYGRAQGYE